MPLVELYFHPMQVHPSVARNLAVLLTVWVSRELSVDEADGQLTEDDVEVRVRGKDASLDAETKYVVQVTVWAKYYKAREAKVDEAAAKILNSVKRLLIEEGVSGRAFVYILLSPAGFAEAEV